MEEKKVTVMRKAVLQEDEGREHVVKTGITREEAEKWISSQNEYFVPDDFYIKEEG